MVTKTPKVLGKWSVLFARIGGGLGGSFVLCGHRHVHTLTASFVVEGTRHGKGSGGWALGRAELLHGPLEDSPNSII